MALIYRINPKELLNDRKKLFLERGVPILSKNDFEKSPFSNSWFGRNNVGDYTYEMCRLSMKSQLEYITTHISRGDEWIKIYLNIFELAPSIDKLSSLYGIDGLQFSLPPNSKTKMRLRIDNFKAVPFFNLNVHKVGFYFTKRGYNVKLRGLGDLIERDLGNINYFIEMWHSFNKPYLTNWSGENIDNATIIKL